MLVILHGIVSLSTLYNTSSYFTLCMGLFYGRLLTRINVELFLITHMNEQKF